MFFADVLLVLQTQVQKTKIKKLATASTNYGLDTTTHASKTKADKIAADADNYTKMAEDTKSKNKTWFPTKSGDTMYFVIPGVTYTDPNLKLLKEKLDHVKNTHGLTSSYKNNTAVVKIIYKGGDASNLYDKLSDDMKEMFATEDMEGNRAILSYKLAKQPEGEGDKKATAVSK